MLEARHLVFKIYLIPWRGKIFRFYFQANAMQGRKHFDFSIQAVISGMEYMGPRDSKTVFITGKEHWRIFGEYGQQSENAREKEIGIFFFFKPRKLRVRLKRVQL